MFSPLNLAAAAAAIVVCVAMVRSVEHRGAEKERARVETAGRKTDAKAQKARSAAAAAPHRALEKYCRDC